MFIKVSFTQREYMEIFMCIHGSLLYDCTEIYINSYL